MFVDLGIMSAYKTSPKKPIAKKLVGQKNCNRVKQGVATFQQTHQDY